MMEDEIKIKVNDPTIGIGDDPVEEIDPAYPGSAANNVVGTVGNLAKQVVRLQFGLLTLPLNLLPSRSRYHAKNSIREGFLSFKSLVDEITTGIDDGLRSSLDSDRVWANNGVDETIPPASL